jgi:hypothetical protein
VSEAGPRRLSRGTSGGPKVTLSSASEGGGRTGSIGGRRFGLGTRQRWRAVCGKGPWLLVASSRESGGRRRGATGSVSDRATRTAQWKTKPACGNHRNHVSSKKGGGPPNFNAPGVTGCDESQLAPQRQEKRHHSESEMPSGYPAPTWTTLFRTQHKRAGRGAGWERAVSQVRASRSRIAGFHGCSLKTSRLQRLVRGIFSSLGRRRFGVDDTASGSSNLVPPSP